MALDKKCKERQHDSPREEPAYSIEKQPTEISPVSSPSVVLCRIVRDRETESGRMMANMHVG